MPNLRNALPPAWRGLAAGRLDPWMLAVIAAGLAGAGWILSPASAAERIKGRLYGVARPPNEVGRALGYAAGYRTNPTIDPLGVLTAREQLRFGNGDQPELRHKRPKGYLHAPAEFTAPIRTQDFRAIAAAAPYRQPGAKPGVAITAADVLRPPAAQS